MAEIWPVQLNKGHGNFKIQKGFDSILGHFRRGNPSVVALVRAGTVACPYSVQHEGTNFVVKGKRVPKIRQHKPAFHYLQYQR